MQKTNSYNYVDGFVIPVPKTKLKNYLKLAKLCSKVWREHGAINYVECVADDVKKGKKTSFPQSVKLKSNELVVLSWITYKSRKHRDQVMQKVMSDPRLKHMHEEQMPFDGMRMFWGGFKPAIRG